MPIWQYAILVLIVAAGPALARADVYSFTDAMNGDKLTHGPTGVTFWMGDKDVVRCEPGNLSHEFRGRDAIQNGLMGHFRSFFAVRPRTVAFNFIAEGDYVVVEARGDNVTKTGQRYDNQYCMVWRIENGGIKEIKEYCDSTLVERVLGPFPEEKKRAAV